MQGRLLKRTADDDVSLTSTGVTRLRVPCGRDGGLQQEVTGSRVFQPAMLVAETGRVFRFTRQASNVWIHDYSRQ